MRRPGPETVAARAGAPEPAPGGAPLVEPPALAAVDAFASLGDLEAAMAGGRGGYRRLGNPSVGRLQEALGALEGWGGVDDPACRVTSSGQAALLLAVTGLLGERRRGIVLLRPSYGGTQALLAGPLARLGVALTILDLPPAGEVAHQLDGVEAVLDRSVAAVVAEAIGNPLLGILDVPRLTEMCRAAGVATVIDGTFATPFLLRPLELGADVVVHSLTKQLAGHSDVVGGAVLVRAGHPAAERLDADCGTLGVGMSPFDAFLALRGLRTAGLRVARSSSSAAVLAEVAAGHPAVRAVHHPGRRSAEEEALAARLLPRGRGAMLTLDLGDRAAATRLLRALPEVRLAPSLGDVATTVSHPAATSHRGLAAAERDALGIGDGLLRFSVGIEEVGDLVAELRDGLDAVIAGRGGAGG